MNFTQDRRNFFIPDAPRGGGDDDYKPWHSDRELAHIFKNALLANIPKPKKSEDAQVLHDMASLLQQRLSSVGYNLQLIAPELRKLAETVNKIPCAADRINPITLAMRFRNMDLTL